VSDHGGAKLTCSFAYFHDAAHPRKWSTRANNPAFYKVEEASNTMADSLISALERVHLESTDASTADDDWIDHILEQRRPRKRIKQDRESLKQELEQKYLTPSPSFSTEWLNKLQQ